MARVTPQKWRSPLAELKHAASEAELISPEQKAANIARLREIWQSIQIKEIKR